MYMETTASSKRAHSIEREHICSADVAESLPVVHSIEREHICSADVAEFLDFWQLDHARKALEEVVMLQVRV